MMILLELYDISVISLGLVHYQLKLTTDAVGRQSEVCLNVIVIGVRRRKIGSKLEQFAVVKNRIDER